MDANGPVSFSDALANLSYYYGLPGQRGTFQGDLITSTPEPASAGLLAAGAAGLLARRRRRHRQAN